MRNSLKWILGLLLAFAPLAALAQGPSNASYVAGVRVATNYAYGYGNIAGANVIIGNTATGTQTLTVCPAVRSLPDGRPVSLFFIGAPVNFDTGFANFEAVTPTSVSLVTPPQGQQGDQQCAAITGTFNQTHGASLFPNQVRSGSFGLDEAINDARQPGGTVVVDTSWGGTNATITAAPVFANVAIVDYRSGIPRNWVPTPTGAAVAAPTGIGVTGQQACDATHQSCSDATVAGSASYAGGAIHTSVTCVDILGNESPGSADATWTDVSSKAIDIGPPAATPGCVGFIPYVSLDAGTYAQAYQIVPTPSICTLTTLTPIPACAVANTTYNQAASTFGANALFNGGAQITAYPVNTSMHFPALGSTAMTAASQTPISNSSVTYSYAPGNRTGACQISSANVSNYAASGSSATTVPNAIATWTIPAGCFNYIGAEFRVSGKFTYTDGGDSSTNVFVKWDSNTTNATTVGTTLCNMADTATGTGAAYNGNFTCTVKVKTTGATGTALADGYSAQSLAAGATTLVRNTIDIGTGATGSINLTVPARVVVYFIGTGATNNPGAQTLGARLEVLN